MSSETPTSTTIKAPTSEQVVQDRKEELAKLATSGIVKDIQAKLTGMAAIDAADESVKNAETKAINRRQSFNTAKTVVSVGAHIVGTVHAVATLNAISAASHTKSVIVEGLSHNKKQQNAIADNQYIGPKHFDAIEKGYKEAFTYQDRCEFAAIMKEYKGKKSLLQDIEKVQESRDSNKPEFLKASKIEGYFRTNMNKKIELNHAISRALERNAQKPEMKEAANNLCLLMTDDKGKTVLSAMFLKEHLQEQLKAKFPSKSQHARSQAATKSKSQQPAAPAH